MMNRGMSAVRRAAAPLLHQARTVATRAAPRAAASASSSSKLLLGALLGGGSLLAAQQLFDSSRLAAAAAEPAAAAPAPARVHVSDLGSIDFRTIGIAPCPPLPEHAPRWLQQLARDPCFQYRDLSSLLDTTGHFLFDALEGDRRLNEVYYFSEKVDEDPNDAAAATSVPHAEHHHPHLAPTLDFAPTTVRLEEPHAPRTNTAVLKPTVTSTELASLKPASVPVATGAPAASAFSTFSTDEPPPLTATGPEVRAVFHVGRALCGHRGIVHGGMTAALMDDVSGAATFCAAGGGHFTANLNINYLKPIRAGQYLLVRAQAVKQVGRKTYVNISVEDGRGVIFARGTALYVKPRMLPPAVLLAATQ
jgi:uncharacterized protein (TIGR00369 family)